MRFARDLIAAAFGIAATLALATGARAAADKEEAIGGAFRKPLAVQVEGQSSAAEVGGGGYRFTLTNGIARVPVVVVGGTPYQMGWHLGRLMQGEIKTFLPAVLAGFKQELKVTDEVLDQVWASTAAYTDDRVEQQLLGLAAGADLPLRSFQQAHCLPLLMPYSCSAIAAWGAATVDGHLYQTRNLDWSLEAGAHEFPVLVVHLPSRGHAHVLLTFAGIIGANCGLSDAGIALSEMGDSPAREMPYVTQAPHFTTWFRTVLYDAGSLSEVLDIFRQQPQTKRYHFVFGDGRTERKAVKIRANSLVKAPEDVRVWKDNDTTDELAPNILPEVVYQDEGRGAFPTLRQQHGALDAEKLIALACQIPIKGGNVLDAVFDATALRLWVSYAGGGLEAYQRPFVFLDVTRLDGDGDGRPDLEEGAQDRDGNGRSDFLDAPTKP